MKWIDPVRFVLRACLCALALLVVVPATALQMGTPFTDGAVLQRGVPVPVWGWAEPGSEMQVSFAGQVKRAKADRNGKWMIKLDPLKANAESQKMVVSPANQASGRAHVINNILVGEVWVASGQSNMQWLASKCDVGRVLQAGIKQRVEAGEEKAPIIREAKVTDVFSALHPIEKAQGEWIDDGANMSGIAYAFAYEIWKELGVPIGIVNCSFSSTAIEAWTPREGQPADAENELSEARQNPRRSEGSPVAEDSASPEKEQDPGEHADGTKEPSSRSRACLDWCGPEVGAQGMSSPSRVSSEEARWS